MYRRITALALTILGAGCAIAGIALIYVPAALIIGGGSAAALGLFAFDIGEKRQGRP